MEPGFASPGREAGEGPSAPSSSSAGAAAGHQAPPAQPPLSSPSQPRQQLSRYESQKRRDWNTFLQHLKNLKPPVSLARCGGAHVIEFMKYLDQFGKTKVHAAVCAHFGLPNPPAPCACPLKQAWGSLDALVGRLRAAYEENGGRPESNPFGTKAVRVYLREVRESQAKARGIPYEKKRKRPPSTAVSSSGGGSTSAAAVTTTVSTGVAGEGSSGGSSAAATLSRTTIDSSRATAAAAAGGSGTAVGPTIAEGSDAPAGGRSGS